MDDITQYEYYDPPWLHTWKKINIFFLRRFRCIVHFFPLFPAGGFMWRLLPVTSDLTSKSTGFGRYIHAILILPGGSAFFVHYPTCAGILAEAYYTLGERIFDVQRTLGKNRDAAPPF